MSKQQLQPAERPADDKSSRSSGGSDSAPRRILQRAASLVKPSGAPTTAARNILPNLSESDSPPPLRRRLTEDLSSTIKNLLRGGKDKDKDKSTTVVRSKSARVTEKIKKGKDKLKDKPHHSRSQSEVLPSPSSSSRPQLSINLRSDTDVPSLLSTQFVESPTIPVPRHAQFDPPVIQPTTPLPQIKMSDPNGEQCEFHPSLGLNYKHQAWLSLSYFCRWRRRGNQSPCPPSTRHPHDENISQEGCQTPQIQARPRSRSDSLGIQESGHQ